MSGMKPIFSKFKDYRPHQAETISGVLSSDAKVSFVEGPTGSGKSLVAMTVAKESDDSLYLCTTKTLQDQLTGDFPVPILKGRSNYPCHEYPDMFPRFSADDCPLDDQNLQTCKRSCPYEIAKREALSSPLAILNTPYFLTETNFIGKFAGREMIVVDECDRLEDLILKFAEIGMTDRLIDRLGLTLPEKTTVYESWLDWATINRPRVERHFHHLDGDIKGGDLKNIKLFKAVKNLHEKLKDFEHYVTPEWIYHPVKTRYGSRYSFRPVWVSDLCNKLFWSHGVKFCLMSATILSADDMARTLGLTDGYDYFPMPSSFDPDHRPVYYNPVANLTYKTNDEELPKAINEVGRILNKYPDVKGIIHTVSYINAKRLMETLNNPRLITHTDGLGRQEALDAFTSSPKPLVLVSPSMDRGVDLHDDLARFAVLLKVPFPSLGDKQVSARFYGSSQGKSWYRWVTTCNVVQISGRAVRNSSDFADTYILDRQFERFYGENSGLFPAWWRDSLIVQ